MIRNQCGNGNTVHIALFKLNAASVVCLHTSFAYFLILNSTSVVLSIYLPLAFGTMSFKGVVLILGAGPRVGGSVASKFASSGYKVALVARNLSEGFSAEGYLNIQADLSDPKIVPSIFQTVKEAFSVPNIVVFNGSCIFIPFLVM